MPSSKQEVIVSTKYPGMNAEQANSECGVNSECDIISNTIKYTILYITMISFASVLPGWFILFHVLNIDLELIPQSIRLFLKILISIEVGAGFLGISSLIMLVNKCLFDCLNDEKFSGQRLVSLFCICIANISITIAGYCILYDLCQLNIENVVDPTYVNFVLVVSSHITGWVLLLISTMIGVRCCFDKQTREVLYKKISNKIHPRTVTVTAEMISTDDDKDLETGGEKNDGENITP